MRNRIEIFLQKKLPEQYLNPPASSGETPVANIEELCDLYKNKYGSFGEITIHVYDEQDMIPFIKALNLLFKSQGSDTKVDARLVKVKINDLTPMIVVDGEIVSRGVYPELSSMRGGRRSVSRGGDGHHEH